jgi:hypothetical protein
VSETSLTGWSNRKDQVWVLMGKLKGSPKVRPLFGLGACKSQDEALQRLQKIVIERPHFREKYRGWTFWAAEMSWILELDKDGNPSFLFRNETARIA